LVAALCAHRHDRQEHLVRISVGDDVVEQAILLIVLARMERYFDVVDRLPSELFRMNVPKIPEFLTVAPYFRVIVAHHWKKTVFSLDGDHGRQRAERSFKFGNILGERPAWRRRVLLRVQPTNVVERHVSRKQISFSVEKAIHDARVSLKII
jgi:hypothetical protein